MTYSERFISSVLFLKLIYSLTLKSNLSSSPSGLPEASQNWIKIRISSWPDNVASSNKFISSRIFKLATSNGLNKLSEAINQKPKKWNYTD